MTYVSGDGNRSWTEHLIVWPHERTCHARDAAQGLGRLSPETPFLLHVPRVVSCQAVFYGAQIPSRRLFQGHDGVGNELQIKPQDALVDAADKQGFWTHQWSRDR